MLGCCAIEVAEFISFGLGVSAFCVLSELGGFSLIYVWILACWF
jgi:hypothetical protein